MVVGRRAHGNNGSLGISNIAREKAVLNTATADFSGIVSDEAQLLRDGFSTGRAGDKDGRAGRQTAYRGHRRHLIAVSRNHDDALKAASEDIGDDAGGERHVSLFFLRKAAVTLVRTAVFIGGQELGHNRLYSNRLEGRDIGLMALVFDLVPHHESGEIDYAFKLVVLAQK